MKKDNEMLEPLFEAGNIGEVVLLTHDGLCHTDDVFTGALLELTLNSLGKTVKFVRTRDLPENLADTIVFDVGGGSLDHHSPLPEVIDRGRPLSSLGKTWRFYKKEFIDILNIDEIGWNEVDKNFIFGIDSTDNTGIMNSLSFLLNCKRGDLDEVYRASGSKFGEAADQAFLDLVETARRDCWPTILNSLRRAKKQREIFKSLPIIDLGGKRFRFSSTGWVDSRGLPPSEMADGFIWPNEEKEGQWKIRPYGWYLRNDVNFPELIFVHSGRWVGEIKGDISLFTKLFPEEKAE
jgi:hypothetical protein